MADNNVCAPRFELVLDWVAQAWASLTEDQIVKSYVQCGIGSTATGDYHSYLRELLENGNLIRK
jgi:hypothetical protein